MSSTNQTLAGRPAHVRSRAGFSIVELMVAITVLTIALGAVASTIIATTSLNKYNRELTIAAETGQSMLETLKNEEFDDVFALYNADPADDPDGPGTAPGNTFAVPRLNLRTNDFDGFVGEVLLPTIAGELREDVADADLGMPRDLNLDDAVDANDHAGDYMILPVRIRLQWTGEAGDQQVEFVTVLGNL